jgi:hypothetical protein
MTRIVIWIDLNAQSVCTYQIWIFLILWCSTGLEDSIDYKLEIFGCVIQKIWIKQAKRRVWFNLKIVSNWILKLWIIITLVDSTYSKDSNDILFEIFRVRKQKLWIMQDSIEIWHEFLFWISFKPEVATCLFPIWAYQFDWICDLNR